MKKLFLLLFTAAMFSACGGTDTTKTEETINPELKEVQKKSDDLKIQSEKLNNKADSILNNI